MNQTVDKLRQNSSNWKLADDAQLCSLLGDISTNLKDRCAVLDRKLTEMKKNTVKLDCIVQNFNVELALLSNRKFIETVIQEDAVPLFNSSKATKPPIDYHADTLTAIKEGLAYAQILSKSTDNPYDTELPSLIGTEEWLASPSTNSTSSEETPKTANNPAETVAVEAPSMGIPPCPPAPPPPPPIVTDVKSISRDLIITGSVKPANTPAARPPVSESALRGGSLFDTDSSSDELGDSPKNQPNIGVEANRNNITSASLIPTEEVNNVPEKPQTSDDQPAGIPSVADLMNASAKLRKVNSVNTGEASSSPKATHIHAPESKIIPSGPSTNGTNKPSNSAQAPPELSVKPGNEGVSTGSVGVSKESSDNGSYKSLKTNSLISVASRERPVVKSLFDSDSDDGDLFKPVVNAARKPFASSFKQAPKAENSNGTKSEPVKPSVAAPKTVASPGPVKNLTKNTSSKVKSLFDSDSDDDDILATTSQTFSKSNVKKSATETPYSAANKVVPSQETHKSSHMPESVPVAETVAEDPLVSTEFSKEVSIGAPPPLLEPVKQEEQFTTFTAPINLSTEDPVEKAEDSKSSDNNPDIPPLIPETDSQSDDVMSGKLNKSAFANMLNSKLAMGPPPVPGARVSKTTDDAAVISKEEDHLPGSAVSKTLPRMGGLPRRPLATADAPPASKLFDDNPKLLPCVTKDRPKGPARRPPTKRVLDTGSNKPSAGESISKDVEQVQEKLAKLDTKEKAPVKNSTTTIVKKPPPVAAPKKAKGLFDSDSDEEVPAATSNSAPKKPEITRTEVKEVKTKSIATTVIASSTIKAPPATITTKPTSTTSTVKPVAKPVRKSLFDDDSDDDLDLFRKKK